MKPLVNPWGIICSDPTPGPTGRNDFADPLVWLRYGVCRVLGHSPGPLGRNDHAEPPRYHGLRDPVNLDRIGKLASAPATTQTHPVIANSVGRHGTNDPVDVRVIQELLNKHLGAGQTPLIVTGMIDDATTQAIIAFERKVLKAKRPDGLVEPGKNTFLALARDPANLVQSGKYWVTWADQNAPNSSSIEDLAEPFKAHLKAFKAALEAAGATVEVTATKRHANRAYLFHWSWLIGLGKKKPSDAEPRDGVDIEWDHGDLKASKAGAMEMVHGFGLAVPPKSTDAPALRSNHIAGKAIDMNITWTGTIKIKKQDGAEVSVAYVADPNANTKLHVVGKSYSVIKRLTDAPHWSVDGG